MLSLKNLMLQMGSKIQKSRHASYLASMFIFTIFAQKLSAPLDEVTADHRTAKFKSTVTQRRAKRTARNPSHLLTFFPIKPGVIFLTGSLLSVPYTMRLEPGIFVISMDFSTGQSKSKVPLVPSAYRKIWTVVMPFLQIVHPPLNISSQCQFEVLF